MTPIIRSGANVLRQCAKSISNPTLKFCLKVSRSDARRPHPSWNALLFWFASTAEPECPLSLLAEATAACPGSAARA